MTLSIPAHPSYSVNDDAVEFNIPKPFNCQRHRNCSTENTFRILRGSNLRWAPQWLINNLSPEILAGLHVFIPLFPHITRQNQQRSFALDCYIYLIMVVLTWLFKISATNNLPWGTIPFTSK